MRLRITRVFDAIVNVSAALAGGLLVALMLATTVKVFFRYVLGEGLNGVDQISGTLLLYIAFLGAAWVAREDEHVRVDLLVKGLSHRLQRWLGVVTSIIGALTCLILAAYGAVEAATSWQRGIFIPAEIEFPRAINLAVIPFGSFLLCLQFIRSARRSFIGERVHSANSERGG